MSVLFAATTEAPVLEWGLYLRLSTMHFLEFAIWGAWFVVLGNYLNSLNFSRKEIGRIYATMALGTVIAPMFVGTIADRYFASEYVMAALHLGGAGMLFWMAHIKTPRKFYWVALGYALLFAPTLALVNSLVFANIQDIERDFGGIRVLGTIGWILAGLSLKFFLKPGEPVSNRPLLLAAGLSLVLGLFSFALPHTPPNPNSEIAFVKSLGLLTDPSFAIFFGVSFVITLGLAFYFSFTSLFLEQDVKVKPENIGPMMSIGQCFEIAFLVSLGWFLQHLGMKWVLGLGMAAWALRYGLFSLRKPLAVIIAGIALHGVCFDFFFAAGFIYVEKTAPADISASAQGLFAVLTYGLGMWLGTEASGWLNHKLTTESTDPETGEKVLTTNWQKFWLIPCICVLVGLILFIFLFSLPPAAPAS